MFEENDGEASVAAIVGVCERDNSLASPSQLVSPLVAPPVGIRIRIIKFYSAK